MIVKNEMANLPRCLGAVADHIDCWVIADTGSTDGTQDFIKSFFDKRSIPGELHSLPFQNFEQARNGALDFAYASALDYDYLLLDDADMELVVENQDFRARLEYPGYRLLQRSDSGLSYWNTRLVQRKAGALYHGVTHEYIDVPGGAKEFSGLWYKDHACGSNRVDKFERDIRLLSEALEREPENHRYWFYLAQSYRDAGRTKEAAETYAKRASMGGWDEEAWHARLEEARCLRKLDDERGFLRQALAAFNQRPQRAEPLYEVAKFYREKGMNQASVLFAEAGLAIPRPSEDILFLEDFVYTAGLQEEFSIAANYSRDPVRKDRGFAACNWLALNREIPQGSRNLARSNLFFYVQPASAMLGSFTTNLVGFIPPDGFHASNPSVARLGEQLVLVQRSVNVTLTSDGQYLTPNGEPEQARNFLLRLGDNLEVQSSTEILPPADMPEPAFPRILGFQDVRAFAWRGELWSCATVRQFNPEGWYEQVLARIDGGSSTCRLTDWRVLRPDGPRQHEKNWMPQAAGEQLRFVYLCDPTRVVDDYARTVSEETPAIAAEEFRGSSQLIPFEDGWLALIHEVHWRDGRRFYDHRFVWFDQNDVLRRVSRGFFFKKPGIEFAAGLAWHPDGRRLLLSYGVDDCESWIAMADADEVRRVLDDVAELPSGWPRAPSLSPPTRGHGASSRTGGEREQVDSAKSNKIETASQSVRSQHPLPVPETVGVRRTEPEDSTAETKTQPTTCAVGKEAHPICTSAAPDADRKSAEVAAPAQSKPELLALQNSAPVRSMPKNDEHGILAEPLPALQVSSPVPARQDVDAREDRGHRHGDVHAIRPKFTPASQIAKRTPPANIERSSRANAKHVRQASNGGKTIGLCMIVKNEAHLILRCLESVRPLVDYVLIEDTGSTDGTQAIVREYLQREGLTGKVFDMPWRDFAFNRSVALAELRKNNQVDYALIMDADDVLVFEEGFDPARFKASLSKDFYRAEVRRATVAFRRGHIVSNRREFRYRGVLHEVLVGPRQYSSELATGFYISYGQEGARGQDPNKYRKDAAVLERALRTEKDLWLRSRYTFYLAQSYYGCHEKEKALENYLKRTEQGFWEEEIYWSYYRAAGLQEALGHPLDDVLATFSKATQACPYRAEALHEAVRRCRVNNRFAEGYELAKRGLALSQPSDGLFIEPWIYQYGLLDEFVVNAYWVGQYDECLEACERLLRERKCPEDICERIERNRDFAREKLALNGSAVAASA
jgi:glycosyltransferase involved in cell wall biosynthesis